MDISSIGFKDIFLYSVLALFIIWVLVKFNMIGAKRGTKKSSKQRDKETSRQRNRRRAIWFMKQFESLYNFIGYSTKEYEFELKYRLERCDVKVRSLERPLKVSELIGIFRFIQILTVLITITVVSLTLSPVGLLILVGIFIPKLYSGLLKLKILSEDEELEDNFPDLYLLLYSRLRKGAHTRIEPTIQDYLNSLDDMYGTGVGHIPIRKFCSRFIANVEIYGDESMAIKRMREHYRSPTMINFCNLAIQSLSGVDNSDKLLTFKQELAEDRRVKMDKRAAALVEKGNKVIFIIYVILFQFIILSWVSKVDLSMFNAILG